jgi:FAD:protein FMN transferase
MARSVTRRRFLSISAAGAGLSLFSPGITLAGIPDTLIRWNGTALGAHSQMMLNLPDRSRAGALIEQVVEEIDRLEKVFSLYRADSAICRLNRDGVLPNPPPELVELLGQARRISTLTTGRFDITVQPLWRLYSEYGDKPISERLERSIRKLVNYRAIEVERKSIRLARPGMAITLNGIAQGYITDRVTGLLRNEGMENCLVQLGEARAMGGHPDGRDWRIGIENPVTQGNGKNSIDLNNRALATSGGYGTPLAGGRNHIFDPRGGKSPMADRSLTVLAENATDADALSTGLLLMKEKEIRLLLKDISEVSVYVLRNGHIREIGEA